MEVFSLKPYGYCSGVLSAYRKVFNLAKESRGKKIILAGNLVHNEDAVASLSRLGCLLLDERKSNLEEELAKIPSDSFVVFSAHGHPYSYEKIVTSKGAEIVDATCPFVIENLKKGEKEKCLIYAGVSSHAEAEAFLANCPHAGFYDVEKKALTKTPMGDKPKLLVQTTLSSFEIEEAMSSLKEIYPSIVLLSGRCHATEKRQEAILSCPPCDLLLVLGSPTSNNSRKLAELGKTKAKEVRLCLNLDQVKTMDFKGIDRVAIASGASTSGECYEEVVAYLRNLK